MADGKLNVWPRVPSLYIGPRAVTGHSMSNRNKNNMYGTCTEHYGTVRNSPDCGEIVGKLWVIQPEHVRNMYGTCTEQVFPVVLPLFRDFFGILGIFRSVVPLDMFRMLRCCSVMLRYVP